MAYIGPQINILIWYQRLCEWIIEIHDDNV